MLYDIDKNIGNILERGSRLKIMDGGIMDKIFDIVLAVVFAVFMAQTFPVLACSDGENALTGAACSISEINGMIKNNKTTPETKSMEARPERNLRPVSRMIRESTWVDEVDILCPNGPCYFKVLVKD